MVRGTRQREAAIDARRTRPRHEPVGPGAPGVSEHLRRIAERLAALPRLDLRTADEILGYDEYGLPR